MTIRILLRAVVLGAVIAGSGQSFAASNAASGFSPENFFVGRTRSAGTLEDTFGEPSGRLASEARGRREADGSVVVEQTIRYGAETRRRTFRIVRTGTSTLEATGSDVVGKASGEIEGRTLRLVSTLRWAPGTPHDEVELEQTFTLQPDGRTLVGTGTISKDGVVLNRLDETIVRQ